MTKARSPGYPVIGLREAIDKVSAVYREDYQNPIPRAVAVKHMGYNGLNGKSLGVLSALSKYSLLEGRGDETRVTNLAVQIIAHPPGSPERAVAIQSAASEPTLFGELDARFQGGKASDQAIRSYLLTMKFIPSAAETTIRAYRETKQLIEDELTGMGSSEESLKQGFINKKGIITQQSPAIIPITNFSYPQSFGNNKEIANIRVSKDCAIRLIADGPYTKRSIEALVKNLQLQLDLGTYDEDSQTGSAELARLEFKG